MLWEPISSIWAPLIFMLLLLFLSLASVSYLMAKSNSMMLQSISLPIYNYHIASTQSKRFFTLTDLLPFSSSFSISSALFQDEVIPRPMLKWVDSIGFGKVLS